MAKKKVPEKVQQIRNWKAEREAGSKSISFSQLSVYRNCPHAWYRAYIKNEAPFVPSIHLIFGTAVHECIQTWLDKLYNVSIKSSEELDLHEMLKIKMRELYQENRKTYGQDFSTAKELGSFYEDGIAILDYVRKHRKAWFDPHKEYLVGCEIPLLYKLQDKFYFKAFLDLVFYREDTDEWEIWDIKTATRGWSAETKQDKVKISQVLLYREFFSKQFGIDRDRVSVKYFIVKRKVDEDAPYPAMRSRVQEFVPRTGPRIDKQVIEPVLAFQTDVVLEEGMYANKEYKATPSEKVCKWCLFKDSCESAI